MIPDHKMLAAGDDGEQLPPIAQKQKMRVIEPIEPIEPLEVPESLDKGRLVKCQICGLEKRYFGNCSGCIYLKKVSCSDCGLPLGDHRMERGRAGRRIWTHKKAFPKVCRPQNDPIQQVAIETPAPMIPRRVWKDVD